MAQLQSLPTDKRRPITWRRAVGLMAALLVPVASGVIGFVEYRLKQQREGLYVPIEAVVAFDAENCPQGWIPDPELPGRTIVGAGFGDGLTAREIGTKGGIEKHTLRESNLPSHSHRMRASEGRYWNTSLSGGNSHKVMTSDMESTLTGNSGGVYRGSPDPITNMPPYKVLLYCTRNTEGS